MKYLTIIKSLPLILLIFVLHCCSNTYEKHIGEWKGESKGEVGSLILDKTKHAVLVIGNEVIGGDDFVIQGDKQGVCKYEIDYSKNPIWLDIVIYEKGKSEELGRLKGIVRFLTDSKMEYRIGFEGKRFENFDPEDQENTIVLDKVTN
jgi:hypothetical protein